MVDLDEEKAKIHTIVAKMGIQDPEERLDKYEELLASIGYNSYFQYRPHLLSDSNLIILREYASEAQEENIDDYISTVLYFSNMEESWEKEPENALIINYNKKFTFLNFIPTKNKEFLREKGIVKMEREYGERNWYAYDNLIYKIIFTNLI